ncbi:branched-chain amino acid aminotransferase [Viridibacillus sp. YIM B01967]|uniref:Branched-chain amino acid aminotransferase n=1 Tax=Viridibacillus soli TaxID=2798301 RepID=A0ABS1HCB5_9BACL|nr:branched-chain amino acid aminotransferase [Viridibacillus soli]MBK3497092.1 branched-chain amino acid aminotransferase [Viridibacillus soli]
MLKQQMEQYIAERVQDNKIGLFDIEKEYAEKHQLLQEVIATEKAFHAQVFERCNKETEDLISTETAAFLNEPISYLKKQNNEFVYVESNIFELVRIDAIALEFDDVFETYTALFGLKLQKKFGDAIKTYLDTHLHGDNAKHSVMFSAEDGLWDVNFALGYVEGFNETQSFEEIYNMIYRFVFKLVEAIEEAQ